MPDDKNKSSGEKTKSKKREKIQKKKRALRRRAKNERKGTDYQTEDLAIIERLYDFLVLAPEDSIICTYLAMPEEVSTIPLIERLHRSRSDLQFYIPRIESRVRDGAKMQFYALEFAEEHISYEKLEPDDRGIMQPTETADKLKVKRANKDGYMVYFIMPGLFFDKKGYRLGYGGGYYDRYLNRHPEARRLLIAPCRQDQFQEQLPHSERDVPVDILAMADNLLRVSKKLELEKEQKAMLKKDKDSKDKDNKDKERKAKERN